MIEHDSRNSLTSTRFTAENLAHNFFKTSSILPPESPELCFALEFQKVFGLLDVTPLVICTAMMAKLPPPSTTHLSGLIKKNTHIVSYHIFLDDGCWVSQPRSSDETGKSCYNLAWFLKHTKDFKGVGGFLHQPGTVFGLWYLLSVVETQTWSNMSHPCYSSIPLTKQQHFAVLLSYLRYHFLHHSSK